MVRILGSNPTVKGIVACSSAVGVDRVQRRIEVFRAVVGVFQIILVGEFGFVGVRIAAHIAVKFVVHIPAQAALSIGQKFVCMDKGGDVAFFQPVILGVALHDEQAFVVVPRVDSAQRGFRRTLEAAARSRFVCIAEAVGEQMLVVQLRVEGRIDVHLRMIDVVDIIQHVFSRIGRAAVVAGQREIVLQKAGVVELDVPVRIFVASCPS